jgi:membrane-bound lytic murein transglycosylase D
MTLQRLLLACLALGSVACLAADDLTPRPPELERDVQFWIRVYSEVTTNEGFLHDEHNLAVVYQTVHFEAGSSPVQRREQLDGLREHYRGVLQRLSEGATDLTADEQRIQAAFGNEASTERYAQALGEMRFQLGQADRFREGIVRSGAWEGHIADTLAQLGLPPAIAALPHVESSFNPEAYSKVGAAGLWQFMRSTGRRFLRIDDAVDERMDPFRATEAAAQLLDFNYRLLGTWPLALTAYNHGAAGMRRARDTMGTSDIVVIVRQHKSPSFGFASRNFYVSFLAALEIDRHPEKYFGPLERRPRTRFKEVEVPAQVSMAALERVVNVDRSRLVALNPALRPPVWNGQRRVPQGYRLRLPGDAADWTREQLAARLPAEVPGSRPPVAARSAPANDPVDYGVAADDTLRVAPAETLSLYADWLGVSVTRLRDLNALRPSAPVVSGRRLKLDFSQVAKADFEQKRGDYHLQLQATFFAGHRVVGTEVYVSRSGDSLWALTQRYAKLPLWLLQQYNPGLKVGTLRAGTQIVVPKVEKVPVV